MEKKYEDNIREIVLMRKRGASPEDIEQISTRLIAFLNSQMDTYNELKETDFPLQELKIDSKTGKVLFDKGTLIHCARECSYEKLLSYKEKGIVTGDFINIPEDGESFLCADFYRADAPMSSTEFFDRILDSDSWACRGPFSDKWKYCTKLAFIIDPNDTTERLTDTDMYMPQNSEHDMQCILNLLSKYKEEKNGQVAAIPYGIPSSCISGIVAGDFLLQNEEYMHLINQIFPNCYILNHEGRVFFDPLLSKEENDVNKSNCLSNLQEFNETRTQMGNNAIKRMLSGMPDLTVDTQKLGKESMEEQRDTDAKDTVESEMKEQMRNNTRGQQPYHE